MLMALAAVPVLVSAMLGLIAPSVARRLPPATAVKILTPAALAAALTTGFSLSVLAFNGLARLSLIARLGRWTPAYDPDDGTPTPTGGVLLGLLVMALLATAIHYAVSAVVQAVRTDTACRELDEPGSRLVVLDDAVPDAFAVAGRCRRIVITSGMVDALGADERAVLIAHERAHLDHHHQIFVQLTDLAARANPLLLRVAAQVRVLIERWADEEAAAAVEDRKLVARAVAKAALARTAGIRLAGIPGIAALGVANTAVAQRVEALIRPQPQPQRRVAVALVALGLVGLLASASIAHVTEQKFERADCVSGQSCQS